MRLVTNMQVTVRTEEALEALKKNRETHKTIVKEAREGYVKKAKKEILKRLEQLKDNKVVSLHFNLQPPQDYTKVYDVAIEMLRLHTEDTLDLNGDQVKHLMMDDWDWMEVFLVANRGYSSTARTYAASKGF
jgi:hypothetical protein